MSDTYREYADIVPEEVRVALEGLHGQKDRKWAVVMLLLEEGELPFSQIKSELDLHPQQTTNALQDLMWAGIVERYVPPDTDIRDKYSMVYDVTPLGDRIINCLYKATQSKHAESGPTKSFTSEEFSEDITRELENDIIDPPK